MTFHVWVLEVTIEWPQLRFRRYHHRAGRHHKRGELTFRNVKRDHTIRVEFERNH